MVAKGENKFWYVWNFINFQWVQYKSISALLFGVAQSVEPAAPGEEVVGPIPAVAIIMWPAETEVMVSPLCLVCGST